MIPDSIWSLAFHLVSRRRQPIQKDKESYSQWRYTEAEKFFSRLPIKINFTGKRVFDFGCGYGSTAVWMLEHGASEACGFDIDQERVEWAIANLSKNHPELLKRLKFYTDIADVGDSKYDYIVSQDCFEHYAEPENIMRTMRGLLAPGGRVLIGFSR